MKIIGYWSGQELYPDVAAGGGGDGAAAGRGPRHQAGGRRHVELPRPGRHRHRALPRHRAHRARHREMCAGSMMTLPLVHAVPGGGERGGDVPGELLLLHPRHHPHLHGQDALHRPALLLQHLQVRPADLLIIVLSYISFSHVTLSKYVSAWTRTVGQTFE